MKVMVAYAMKNPGGKSAAELGDVSTLFFCEKVVADEFRICLNSLKTRMMVWFNVIYLIYSL